MTDQPDELTEDSFDDLVSQIKDYQLTHGFLLKLVRLEGHTTVPSRNISVSVLPTPFPRHLFRQASDLQTLFNELYIRASADEAWLNSVVSPLLQYDDLARALWEVHTRVKSQRQDGEPRTICGIFRSDYMLQAQKDAPPKLRQVEMNTFSVAGACHSERAAKLHAHMRRVGCHGSSRTVGRLAVNENIHSLTEVLKRARQLYAPTSGRSACVLMIVQANNFNIADERPIDYALWDKGIACCRCEWHDVLSSTSLTGDQTLIYHHRGVDFEVGVVYYRAGYEPEEYDEQGVETRVRLEVSRAIKCPDVLTHLTTFKAVQQALTRPGAVERFLSTKDSKLVRATFMFMQALDSTPEGSIAKRLASKEDTAATFVLKPNLEGGGHNIYRQDICSFLATLPEERQRSYILMRLIEPPMQEGLLMGPDDLHSGPVVSELGVLGTCIWRSLSSRDDKKAVEILENNVAGWTFKTKPTSVDEMSVVKGYGCFDCPDLGRC